MSGDPGHLDRSRGLESAATSLGRAPTDSRPQPRSSIRVGNQTAASAASPFEPFEFALRHGFDAFEFFPDFGCGGRGGWDERHVNDAARQEIRHRAAARRVWLSVHAPLAFEPLKDARDPRLESTVAFARAIDARLINLHLDASRGPDRFLRALRPALRLITELGMNVALENTVWTAPEDFNDFFGQLRQTEASLSSSVGMCFDLGHANACAATRNDYCGFLDRLDTRVPIIHLHLHENWGDRDSHLPLFTGPSALQTLGLEGFVERLRARGFTGMGILEQWPRPPSLLADTRARFLKLFESTAKPPTVRSDDRL